MAFVTAGPNSRILVGPYDLSRFFNSVSMPSEVGVGRTTGFGKAAHTYIPILRNGTLALEGYFDGAVDAVDEELAATLGSNTAKHWLIAMDGTTPGARVSIAATVSTAYEVSGEVADVVKVSAEAQTADSGVESGISMWNVASINASGGLAGTVIDNAAATTNGGVAQFHVLAFGTSVLYTIEHSVDASVWVALTGSFTDTTLGTRRVTVTGTVNRYLRATANGAGGNVTLAMAFARRYL